MDFKNLNESTTNIAKKISYIRHPLEKLSTQITPIQFLEMYNNAIDEIHYLRFINSELKKENDMLWKAYDDVSTKLYG